MIQNMLDAISEELGYILPRVSFDGKSFLRFGKKDCCWLIGHSFRVNKCECYIAYYGDFSKNSSSHKTNISFEDLPSTSKSQFNFHLDLIKNEVVSEKKKLNDLFTSRWNRKFYQLKYQQHAYIALKAILPYRAVTLNQSELIIPIFDENDCLKGIQKIIKSKYENTFNKFFEKGSLVQGNFYNLNSEASADLILVSEGFATAATIQELFPEYCSICVFTANNLTPAVNKIRKLFPEKRILICADLDKSQTGEKEALNASLSVKNCFYILPSFKDGSDQLTDFNDLFISEGRETVSRQISASIASFNEGLFDLDIKSGFTKEVGMKKVKDKECLRKYFDYKYQYFVSGGNVYGFDQTHFSIFTDSKIAEFAQNMYSLGGTVENRDIQEFISLIRRTNLKSLDLFPPIRGFNFLNGFLPLNSDVLISHSPDHFQFHVIPHRYDTKTEAPTWKQALQNTSCNDNSLITLIHEYIGYILSNDEYSRHSIALILDGYGNNGKTTLFTAIRNLCGIENTSSVSIADLSKNRFSLSCLKNKLVNFDEEASGDIFRSSEMFKKITGGSSMQAEEKYKSSYEYINRAKVIISYNVIPSINDISKGMARRLLFIPCNQDYGENSHLKIANIDSKLLSEASGIINLAINAYNKVEERGGFSFSEASNDRKNEVLKLSNPLIDWFETHLLVTNNIADKVSMRELFENYLSFSKSNITSSYFGRQINIQLRMLANANNVNHKDIKINNRTVKGVIGIRLKSTS